MTNVTLGRMGLLAWRRCAITCRGLCCRGFQRHAYAEVCSRPLSFDDFNSSAMRGHEFHDHGQTNARPLDVSGRGLASIKGLEHVFAFLARYTGAAVGDFEHQVTVIGARPDMYCPAARRVLDGV